MITSTSADKSLWAMQENMTAIIDQLSLELKTEHILRLREIGIEKGQSITCLKITPFKGPHVFQIGDSVFSLEASLASKIFIS